MNSAKFEATLVDFKVNGKKTVLKLELTNGAAARNFGFLVGSLDKDVNVQLGDPQVSMEELGVKTEQHAGLSYSVQKDGTVDKVDNAEEQSDLFDADDDPDWEDDEQNDTPDEDDFDFPDEDLADEPSSDDDQQPGGEDEDETPEPKDEVEAWILNGNAFSDEEVDWEALLRRKKAGETWMAIANSIGTSSTKLSTTWNAYKKRVKEYLAGEQGVA